MSVQVGSYIQGQIIVSFCIGILLFIGYSIIGLDYGLVLACIVCCYKCCTLSRTNDCYFTSHHHSDYYIAFHVIEINCSMDACSIY